MAASGSWRMVVIVGALVAVSFLFVPSVEAQGTCNPPCSSHAYCYTDYSRSTYFCACNGYYTGNGYSCKYSTWRLVLYILSSVIGFILIFLLCLSCMGYFRRQQFQQQPVGYPMQPMGNSPYGYPPPPAPTQNTANPAAYSSYTPQTGYPQSGYAQTGYPANSYPPQVANQQNAKTPGPSGVV